jgi:type II secretory pathway pseudopilin PulG
MTLIELLVVYAVLAVLIWLLVGLSRNVRNEAKQEQATRLMAALSRAMAVYQMRNADYPPGGPGTDATGCLLALSRDSACKAVLQGELPARWRAVIGEDRPWTDPWGTPLRYVRDSTLDQGAEAGRIPYLESAGMDRDFGDSSPGGLARTTDNLRTDEPLAAREGMKDER